MGPLVSDVNEQGSTVHLWAVWQEENRDGTAFSAGISSSFL